MAAKSSGVVKVFDCPFCKQPFKDYASLKAMWCSEKYPLSEKVGWIRERSGVNIRTIGAHFALHDTHTR